MTTCNEILQTVIENGRVLTNDNGSFQKESLVIEVEFEASEKGLSETSAEECVEYALENTENE